MVFPPQGRLLIVSPHFDDAALSCGALLERAEPIDVLTVFAGEPDPPQRGPWDLLTGFRDSRESIAGRRAEEVAALRGTGHRVLTLDLHEDQYLDVRPRPAAHADVIADAVERWASDGAGSATVAVPAGAGRRRGRLRAKLESYTGTIGGPLPHPDHEFVRDACLAAAPLRDIGAVLLYAEIPYVFGGSGERAASEAAAVHDLVLEPIEAAVDREAKARRIAAYASQVPHLATSHPRLDRAESLPATERYWRLRHA